MMRRARASLALLLLTGSTLALVPLCAPPRLSSARNLLRSSARRAPQPIMASRFKIREKLTAASNVAVEAVLGNRLGRSDDASTPAVLSEEICLAPGKPVVRVEVAPGNARRIFTGVDIVAEGDVLEAVWSTLTDYANLASVVPNLVSNEVLSSDGAGGARLRQVGAAQLAPGIRFCATSTLDVRVYPAGLPAQMEADHLESSRGGAQSTDSAAVREFGSTLPLTRDVFPRPYCISSLPHRDVTMADVAGAEGDFRHYQGVWRMQPLPGCAPPGADAMRLTYSVELSPRAWVPVALLEGRIASALGENLEAIRDYVVSRQSEAATNAATERP